MLVRSISLKNIRSYGDGEETRLELPEGVVLFEGDVGSGKSTLLYSLEFALFGLSDMRGAHLLAEGRREGRVTVTFEADGERYTIDRSLKARGEEVVQDECYITADRGRERLSATDLKERVVSILGFNEPTHPRAESLVYRYAVFTPQEQMKEILVQNPQDRLHVIRRVLGAQSYQVASENSEVVEKKLREMAYGLKKASEDLEEKRDEMEERSRAVAQLESEIPRLEREEAAASKLVRTLEAEWKDSIDQRGALSKNEVRIPMLKQEIVDLQTALAEEDDRLRELEGELRDEIEPAIRRFEDAARPPATARQLEARLNIGREQLTRLTGARQNLEAELSKARDLIAKGTCPLCGQKITGDFGARTEHAEGELARLEKEAADASRSVSSLGSELDAAREHEEIEKEYRRASKRNEKVGGEIQSLRKKLHQRTAAISQRTSALAEAQARTKEIGELSDRISELSSRLQLARAEEKEASLDLNRARTELADAARSLETLAAEVRRKEEQVDEARHLTNYQAWLGSFFRPTVQMIERQTLTQAASRFSEHFQRFFTALIDDPDMIVKVREDFSPVFEREGFEQDYQALSGGERTSMALAYRFALNQVVKESASSRPELIVLDEPTDGFSKEQVYRMRGLLDELASRQVILVSHERELESMADHIFRVEKRNGMSVVTKLRP